jgi:hypothetical protein
MGLTVNQVAGSRFPCQVEAGLSIVTADLVMETEPGRNAIAATGRPVRSRPLHAYRPHEY